MFNTADFPAGYAPDPKIDDRQFDTCRYRGFRTPNTTGEEEPYVTNMMYWHVFGARLAFVAVFEVSVGAGVNGGEIYRLEVPDQQTFKQDF